MMDLFSRYMYEVIDFFLPLIFLAIYFPFIMSKKTERVVIRLWHWLKRVALKNK
tara:strand:+ start:156 stop:317 length:162 start_codon:yes stop_codon:yes gene_type:complete